MQAMSDNFRMLADACMKNKDETISIDACITNQDLSVMLQLWSWPVRILLSSPLEVVKAVGI